MTPVIQHTRGYVVHRASGDALVVIRRGSPPPPTTVTECFLLMAVCGLLPLQGNLPKIGQLSSLFLIFGVMMLYVVLCRPGILVKTLRHPVFLTGDALVGIGFIMEVVHSSTGYYRVFQLFLMLMGAALIASLCRDRRALRYSLYGLLLAGVWLSVTLSLSTYTSISSANISGFIEASQLRSKAIRDTPIEINWNTVAFFAAQSVGLALALALTTSARLQHYVFLAMGAVCMVGTFLTMSRGALVNMIIASAAVLYTYGIKQVRVVGAVMIFAVVILLWVPEAVFNRLSITGERDLQGRDVSGRTTIYTAVIKNLPEYILTGVGVEHFKRDWGWRAGFVLGRNEGAHVAGAHNCYIQVTIYWGLLGLLALLALVWKAYRCLPQRYSAEPLSLCILSVAISVFVYSFFMHVLEDKAYSIALGLLVGTNLWIWSRSTHRAPKSVHTTLAHRG